MKKYNIFLSILFFTVTLNASAQRTISGRITDAEDGEPIPGASVFIAGTTVGMSANAEGYYRLVIPGPGSYKLAISHAGYQPVYKDIEPGQSAITLNIEMNYHELKETIVTAKVKFREEDINLFWKTILGKKPSNNKIFAINSDEVFYYYDKKADVLTVTCRSPLQILNFETGYQIEFLLKRFIHNYSTKKTEWEALFNFKDIIPKNIKQKKEWDKNREKVNMVSLNRFMKLLYKNNSMYENGFILINAKVEDTYLVESESNRVRAKKGEFIKKISISNPENFQSFDSVTKSKQLFIPADSNIIIVCYGKSLVEKDLLNALYNNYNKGDKKWNLKSKFMTQITTPEGIVKIFPDGTFKNMLYLTPWLSSKPLTGLNMMLPTNYCSNNDLLENLMLNKTNSEEVDISDNLDLQNPSF